MKPDSLCRTLASRIENSRPTRWRVTDSTCCELCTVGLQFSEWDTVVLWKCPKKQQYTKTSFIPLVQNGTEMICLRQSHFSKVQSTASGQRRNLLEAILSWMCVIDHDCTGLNGHHRLWQPSRDTKHLVLSKKQNKKKQYRRKIKKAKKTKQKKKSKNRRGYWRTWFG